MRVGCRQCTFLPYDRHRGGARRLHSLGRRQTSVVAFAKEPLRRDRSLRESRAAKPGRVLQAQAAPRDRDASQDLQDPRALRDLRRRRFRRQALHGRTMEGRLPSPFFLALRLFRQPFPAQAPASPDERVFGCGERYDRLDLKGGRRPFGCVTRAASRLGASSYPLPAYVSTKDYWCAVDSPAYARIDFRRASTTWKSGRCLAKSSSAGGRTRNRPSRPEYSWGAAGAARLGVRRRLDRSPRRDRGDAPGARAALRAGVKVAALWSRDWCSSAPAGPGARALRECHFDEELYPGLPAEIAALRARGSFLRLRLAAPRPEGSLYAEASAQGSASRTLRAETISLRPAGLPAAMIDLTGPKRWAGSRAY